MTDQAEQQHLLYQQLTQAILNQPGATEPAFRSALTNYTQQAALTGKASFAAEDGIAADLQSYVTKVRKHAYKVTDEDIARLREAGYSEEAIFEITVSVALGAGTKCLTSGLAALEGASEQ